MSYLVLFFNFLEFYQDRVNGLDTLSRLLCSGTRLLPNCCSNAPCGNSKCRYLQLFVTIHIHNNFFQPSPNKVTADKASISLPVSQIQKPVSHCKSSCLPTFTFLHAAFISTPLLSAMNSKVKSRVFKPCLTESHPISAQTAEEKQQIEGNLDQGS